MPDDYTKLLLKFDKGFLNIADYGTTNPSTIGDGIYLYCDTSGPFLGASSYLHISDSYSMTYAASSDWDLAGDFTIDFYVKLQSFPSTTYNFMAKSSGWNVGYGTSGFVFRDGDGSTILSYSSGWSLGVWYHVAITRSGGTYRLFRDGNLLLTTTYTPEITNGTTLNFNAWSSGDYRLANVRISVGIARWTSNFTKPASYHTADSYTKFLVTFEMDYVKRHNFVYADGPSKHELNTKKWGRASWKGVSGAPSYGESRISGNTADFALGTGDFTFDFWCNLGGSPGSSYSIVNMGAVYFEWLSSGPSLRFRVGSRYLTTSIAQGTWYHIAGVRSESNCMLFKNGVLQQSGTAADDISDTVIDIGGTASTYTFYLDELRLSKGIARWTSNFTPPTGEYLDYKLSGTASTPCTLTILNDATKVVEEERQVQSGSWTISPLTNNKKIIMAKLESGETLCYGEVWPVSE